MVKGYMARKKDEDGRQAYFVALNTNVHIPKATQRIKVRDIMKSLYPPTREDRLREELEFMKEWEEQVKLAEKEGEESGTD